jgi:hypothetical protein
LAVLVEAISVIVRRDSIVAKFLGGWDAFVDQVPNATFCADEHLARVGFMTPDDVEIFVKHLEEGGLTCLSEDGFVDLAVVDQQNGPTQPCNWLEFSQWAIPELGEDAVVSACWLFTEPRDWGDGIYMPAEDMEIAFPGDWQFEGSLSQRCQHIPSEQLEEQLKFLRHENGLDVYLDQSTGKEVYVGRTR